MFKILLDFIQENANLILGWKFASIKLVIAKISILNNIPIGLSPEKIIPIRDNIKTKLKEISVPY